jgi:stage II sporulation protein P
LSDGSKYRPVTEWKNKPAAQMMILVGTGKKTAPNDHWETNLSFATELYRAAEDLCENIMRPILLRNSGYNQHLSTGSLLVEMGTCGNSLEEAERAAEVLGDAIIRAFAKK